MASAAAAAAAAAAAVAAAVAAVGDAPASNREMGGTLQCNVVYEGTRTESRRRVNGRLVSIVTYLLTIKT